MKLRLVDRRVGQAGPPPAGDEAWLAPARAAAADLALADWIVDVVLVEDEAMAGLNAAFRGREGVTDVLSFSYLCGQGQGDPDLAAGRGGAAGDLWLEAWPQETAPAAGAAAGEVVLAPGFVSERCGREGWALADEFTLLVVHGCLHLLGWDHQDQRQLQAMQEIESRLLGMTGIEHPLRKRS